MASVENTLRKTSSESDSDSDKSSLFDSAPSSPSSTSALKEERKLKKLPDSKTPPTFKKEDLHHSVRPLRPVSQYVTPPLPMEEKANVSSFMRGSKSGQLRKKHDPQKRYSTTLADLRLPPSRMSAQKEHYRVESRERTLNSQTASTSLKDRSIISVPRAPNWQLPPHIQAQRRMSPYTHDKSSNSRLGLIRQQPRSADSDPANVLKLKISCTDTPEDIVAIKLRKDRLRSPTELVDVVMFKLAGKLPCSKEKVKISLVFPDSSLKPVKLKSPSSHGAQPYASEDFMMGYIQAKRKIYVRVSS